MITEQIAAELAGQAVEAKPDPRRGMACMGGWCSQRGHCSHYHAPAEIRFRNVVERLCPRGQDMPAELVGGIGGGDE